MRIHRLVLAALSTLCLASALGASGAGAAQVAYVDGGQIWVSTLDGAAKRSLSGPSPDAKSWTETAQAQNGTVIGVRREPGKIGTLNATTLWSADGTVIGNGSLTAPTGRTSYAYPVTLSLTPDGKVVTYGYANWSGFGLNTVYEFGTYAEGSSGWYIEPFDVRGVRSGTLTGNRLVGVSNANTSVVSVQNASGQPPYSEEFTPWLNVTGLERAEVSANGTVLAVEIRSAGNEGIAMFPVSALGGTLDEEKGCDLPTQGNASQVTLSADGTTMAWHDARGVVVSGTPVWFATPNAAICNLSSPPVVISPTGRMPSLGDSTFATPPNPGDGSGGGGGGSTGGGSTGGGSTGGGDQSPPAPTPVKGEDDKKGGGQGGGPTGGDDKNGGTKGGADTPTVAPLPTTLKASALAGGLAVSVKVAGAGKVTAIGKVGSQVVAKGATKAKRAGKVTLRLKATAAWSKRLAQLSGKTLKITVTGPGGTTRLSRKLG
jgi:hypothetical protein